MAPFKQRHTDQLITIWFITDLKMRPVPLAPLTLRALNDIRSVDWAVTVKPSKYGLIFCLRLPFLCLYHSCSLLPAFRLDHQSHVTANKLISCIFLSQLAFKSQNNQFYAKYVFTIMLLKSKIFQSFRLFVPKFRRMLQQCERGACCTIKIPSAA